ncbi:peptidylprolyl isomerase [Salinibacillus xinjiangensis]|uniref:peptidylprolyl isomerase n=1 Tax=Salinibacillus xinjiangensis TaxID=1229268 RepID=A0A6G1XBA8_9BACI|nr:peptidyl-prolyl cis-trans isomerase [Salinibacillus xinjiangensis]MRG88195.1 protein secretion protein [Salinibacillus xinjiangensis]
MSKRLLWGMIVILIITNIASILILSNKSVLRDAESGEKLPKEVAIVGDKSIKANQWIQSLQGEYGEEHLKKLINQEVVFQLAEQNDLSMDDKFLQRELAVIQSAAGLLSEEELEQKREQWETTIRYQAYLRDLLTQNIGIDENELNEAYQDKPDQYDFAKSYQLSQIMVEDSQTANQIVSELENGASFANLAREYSIDLHTKNKGGYLGYFPEDNTYLPDIYFNTAENMETNTYSQPFEISDGTVILYLHQELPSIDLEYEDVKNELRREIAMDKIGHEVSAEQLWGEVGVKWIYGD